MKCSTRVVENWRNNIQLRHPPECTYSSQPACTNEFRFRCSSVSVFIQKIQKNTHKSNYCGSLCRKKKQNHERPAWLLVTVPKVFTCLFVLMKHSFMIIGRHLVLMSLSFKQTTWWLLGGTSRPIPQNKIIGCNIAALQGSNNNAGQIRESISPLYVVGTGNTDVRQLVCKNLCRYCKMILIVISCWNKQIDRSNSMTGKDTGKDCIH